MEGSPSDKIKQTLDQYPSSTFWDEIFCPLRVFLAAKVHQQFIMFSDADVLECADETLYRTFQSCNFELLSQLPQEQRDMQFFAFLRTTLCRSAVDLIRQRSGRYKPEPSLKPRRSGRVPSAQMLWEALNSLDLKDQEVIQLKDVEDLTYQQIAEYYARLGIDVSEGALKKRRLRALVALSSKVKQLLD